MPYSLMRGGEFAECPCCGIRANSLPEIGQIFGFRTMSTGRTIPQSYCYSCRAAKCTGDQPCRA